MSLQKLKEKYGNPGNYGYGSSNQHKSLLDRINPLEIAKEKKRQEEAAERARADAEITRKYLEEKRLEDIDRHTKNIADFEKNFHDKLAFFYADSQEYERECSSWQWTRPFYQNYEDTCSSLNNCIENIKAENTALIQLSSEEDKSALIDALSQKVEEFRAYESRVHQIEATATIMMDPNNYGQINKEYWSRINSIPLQHVHALLEKWELALSDRNYTQIYTISPEDILGCVWGLSIAKPYSAADAQRACMILRRVYKNFHFNFAHIDTFIAELYAKKQVGGEDIVRESVREYLKKRGAGDANTLTILASSLMWMNAYQAEEDVLRSMLANGVPMNAKIQERLHVLSNGGGTAPSGLDHASRQDMLYFDVSALAWKDENYAGLFDNLAFQDKQLNYSLAIRSEDKDLMVARELVIPTMEQILKKLDTAFSEEYGGSVSVGVTDCTALSDGNEEYFSAILLAPRDCKQLSVLTYVMRIGRKLNIKFYTLFMPTEASLPAQKQQAISLLKKLSPSVSMWEDSIKSTALMAIQQLLNTNDQSNLGADLPSSPNSGNPIF